MTTINVNNDYVAVTRTRQNADGSTVQEITKYNDSKTIEIFKKADLNGNKQIDTKEELEKFEALKAEQEKTTSNLNFLSQALSETEIEKPGTTPQEPSTTDKNALFVQILATFQELINSLAEILGITTANSDEVPATPVTPEAPVATDDAPAAPVTVEIPTTPTEAATPAEPAPATGISPEQQKLLDTFKNLIDGVDENGVDDCNSKGQRKERILKYIDKMDAETLKTFFKENPEYVEKLHDSTSGFFNSDDEVFHQLSKKLVEARREQYNLGNQPKTPNSRDHAEDYAEQLINLDLDDPNITSEYLTRLANNIASLGNGGKVYQEILDLDCCNNETKASINFIKLLAMAD